MTTKKLFDYQNDENLALFVLIKAADVRVAKNGKQFIAFTFQDQSDKLVVSIGMLLMKMWPYLHRGRLFISKVNGNFIKVIRKLRSINFG